MRQWERSLHFPVAWVRFRSETEAEFFSGSRSAMRVFFLRVLGFLYSPKFNSPDSNFQWVEPCSVEELRQQAEF